MTSAPLVGQLQRIVIFGPLGPPTLAFARTCASNGIRTYLLEKSRHQRTPSGRSSALAGAKSLPAALTGTCEGIKAIMSYCNNVNAQALITVSEDDLLWLTEYRDHFEPGIKVLAASQGCLKRLQSKQDQIELARRSGFEILPTWLLRSSVDCMNIPQKYFPICLRPAVPSLVEPSFKAQIHYSQKGLVAALEGFTRIDGPVVAQPFLKLPDLKVHGARSEAGEVLAMRPFFVERKFEGVSLTLRRAIFPPGLEDCCRRFANLAGIVGGFHFDLLFDSNQDRAYYLEVNVRMGGITDKAKAFGYDQPAMIMDCFGLGRGTWKPLNPTTRTRVVTKRSVLKHMIVVLAGHHSELDYPQVSRSKHLLLSVRDLLIARDSVFDWHDLVGTFWFNLQRP